MVGHNRGILDHTRSEILSFVHWSGVQGYSSLEMDSCVFQLFIHNNVCAVSTAIIKSQFSNDFTIILRSEIVICILLHTKKYISKEY